MAIITFAQVKGGSGKTTAAMCTVAELVARKTSVAALDLDPNRPLGEFFRRVPELKDLQIAVPDSEHRVTTLVRELAKTHDNVVIDLMGAATNDTQVAMALADLVRLQELDRLRLCEADDCRAVLVDLSRNHSRRYCDTGNCGNRQHVAAYRARRRSGDGGGPGVAR